MVSIRNMTPEIIIGSSEFKGFLQNWRGALRDRETIDRDYWEGRLAYAELKRTGYLQRLRFAEGDDNGITPRRQLPKICSAIDAYRRDTNRVRHLNDLQKSHVEWLEKKEREFSAKHGTLRTLILLSARIFNCLPNTFEKSCAVQVWI